MIKLSEKQFKILSVIATIAAICMYVSYIPQIEMNLNGQKGSAIQPLAAAINCTLWVTYALLKEKKDYPVAIANAPGVILGAIAFFTAL